MDFELEDRAVISVSGPDAREFLQGLITNDTRRVGPQSLHYAALLTPQGKILFDFLLTEREGALLLDCPADSRDALVKRLSMYRLRAKVEIAARPDLAVVWRSSDTPSLPFVQDPRRPELGLRAIADSRPAPGATAFEFLRLQAGIPEGRDFGQDKVFALDGDLDELGGIAFDKGCYVGQELTARMKHRGTARKRLLPVSAQGGVPLPPPETPVRAGDRELGTIQSVYGDKGFALMRLDRLAESDGASLHAQEVAVSVRKPAWLFS